MTKEDVKAALLTVLDDIQTICALPSPTLEGTDVPSKVLPKFDSIVWPVAITRLANALDVDIPPNVHIFGGKGSNPPLTVDQTVDLVMKKSKPKAAVSVAAE
jgi:hypothetical protein